MQAIIFLCLLLSSTFHLFSSVGTLDMSFGSGGWVSTSIQTSASSTITACATQPDGKIVVVGNANPGFAIARYTSQGVLDTTFNSNGTIVTTAMGTGAYATGVAIDNAGNIVVCGTATNSLVQQFVVARYTPAGVLDTTFNSIGYVKTTVAGGSAQVAYGIALASGGKIVICGTATISSVAKFAVLQYTGGGALDTSSFGSSTGYVTTTIPTATAQIAYGIALTSVGKIVICGTATLSGVARFAVLQYTSIGALDTAFNSNGYVTTGISSATAQVAYGIALTSAGKIVICGTATISSVAKFAVLQYTSTGALDTSSFGSSTGYVTTSLDGGADQSAHKVIVDSTGKIIVGGFANINSSPNFIVLAYTSAGALDTSEFNPSAGYNTFSFFETTNITGLSLQSNNRIVQVATGGGLFNTVRYLGNTPPQGCIDATYNSSGTNPGYVTNPTNYTASDRPQVVALQPLANNSTFVLTKNIAGTPASQLIELNSTGSVAISWVTIDQLGGADVIVDSQGRALVVGTNVTPRGWIARYVATPGNPGLFALDSTFNGGAIKVQSSLPTTTSYFRVGEQTSGNILVMGQNNTTGIIVAYNQDGTINTNFGTSGVISLASSTLYDMIIAADDSIYVTYKGSSPHIIIAKYLASGTGLATTTFGTSGIVDTSLDIGSYGNPALAFDTNGNIIFAAINSSSSSIEFRQYAAANGTTTNATASIATSVTKLSSPLLTKLQCDTNNRPIFTAYDGTFFVVGRLIKSGSAYSLDTTFAPYQSNPGNYSIAPGILKVKQNDNNPTTSGTQPRVSNSVIISPNGSITFAGYENITTSSSIAVVGQIVGDTTPYSQVARYPGAQIGQIDTTFGTSGALSLAASPGSLPAGQAKAMYVLPNDNILVADSNGTSTNLAQLTSAYALDTSNFNASTGYINLSTMAQATTMLVDAAGNIYLGGTSSGGAVVVYKVNSAGTTATMITIPTATATAGLTSLYGIVQQASGRILICGYNSNLSSGVIMAYNPIADDIDVSFNSTGIYPGYWLTDIANPITSMSCATQASYKDKIYFAYEDTSGKAVVRCLLENGSALDTNFSFGTGISSVSAADQINMQLDANGKVVLVARTSTGFVASRYTATGANDVNNLSIPLTNPSTVTLKKILSLSNGSSLILGMNTNGNTVEVASLNSAFALDTNFNYSGATQGVLQTAVSSMVDFYGIDVTSDQGIIVCGDNNATAGSANPYMTRIFNSAVVTKVSQSALSTPSSGTLDTTLNPAGSTAGFVNCASQLQSTQFPTATTIRAMTQQANGTYFIGASTNLNSYITLMSDDDVQNSIFGTSGLVTISGNGNIWSMLIGQSGQLLVIGGSGSSGSNAGWLQSLNATTGAATAGFTPPTGAGNVLDAHYAIAQQSNGRILVAGTVGGVASIIAYNPVTGALDTTFAAGGIYTATGYIRMQSLVVDALDNIYFIANDSSNNSKVVCIAPTGGQVYWTQTLIAGQSSLPVNNHLAINQAGNVIAVACNSTSFSIVMNSFTPGVTGGTAGTALTLGVGATGVSRPYVTSMLIDSNASNGKIILTGYDNNATPNTPFIIRILGDISALDTTFNAAGAKPGVQSYQTLTSGVVTNWYTGMINGNGKITVGGYASVLTTPYLMRVYGDQFIGQFSPNLTPSPAAGTPGSVDTNFGTAGKVLLAGISGAGSLAGLTAQCIIPTSTGQYYISCTNGSVIRLTNNLALDTTWGPLGTGFAAAGLAGNFSMIIDGSNSLVLAGTTSGAGWLQRYMQASSSLDTTFNTNATTALTNLGCVAATIAAQQTSGRYLIAGTKSGGNAAIFALTNTGRLDTTFHNPTTTGGWFDTGVTGGLYAMTVDVYDRIIIAYKNGSNVDVVRLTSAGQIDTSFHTTGSVTAAITGADDATQIRVCLDQAGNIILAAHTNSGISLRGLMTSGENLYSQLNISTIITSLPVLTNLIATSDGNVVVSGYQSGANPMWAARLTVAGVLDTTFGGGEGIMTFDFDAAGTVTARALNGIAIYGDGQIAMVGTETNSVNSPTVSPFLSMAYNNPYTTQVSQAGLIQPQGSNDTTLGASIATTTNLGITFVASSLADASSGQVARAIALQDDASIVVAVDGGASSGSATPSNIYLKMFDIDGVANTSFGISGQQTVLSMYQNQHVQDLLTFTTVAGVHNALLAGYVSNLVLGTTSSVLLQYNLDTHQLDTSFGGFDTNPSGIAYGDGQQINVLGQQSNGRIIASGMSANSTGLTLGYTPQGKLDASFATGGCLDQSGCSGIYSHAIDTQNRILIGWVDSSSGYVKVSRFLPDGSGLDTTFGAGGTVSTGATTYGDSGVRIALDGSNNVFVARVAAAQTSVTVYAFAASNGATLYTAYTPALSLTTFFITKLVVDSSGLLYVFGYDAGTNPQQIVIARLLANLSGLDTSFNGSTGYKKYGVTAGSTQVATDALIHPDGRILIVGNKA